MATTKVTLTFSTIWAPEPEAIGKECFVCHELMVNPWRLAFYIHETKSFSETKLSVCSSCYNCYSDFKDAHSPA